MKLAKWAQAVKERDGWCCQDCGATDNLHAHHIKPRVLGGRNTLKNGITLCEYHHRKTHEARGHTPVGLYQMRMEMKKRGELS